MAPLRLLSAACCAALATAAFRIMGVSPNPATLGSALVLSYADAPSPFSCQVYVDAPLYFDTSLLTFTTAGATGSLSFVPDAALLPVGSTHQLYILCDDGWLIDSETPRLALTTRIPGSAVIDAWPGFLEDGSASTLSYTTVGLVGTVTLVLSISGYTWEFPGHPTGSSVAIELTPPHEVVMRSSTAELVVRGTAASNGLLVASAPRVVQLRSRPPNVAAQLTRDTALRGLAYANAAYLSFDKLSAWSRQDVASVCPECAQLGRAVLVRTFHSSVGTEFFVLRRQDGAVVVGFRGTESWDDGRTDLSAALTGYAGCALCELHRGFLLAYESVVSQLGGYMREAVPSTERATTPVVLAGHSLGAALATIAAFELQLAGYSVQGVFTYGSPRVGNGFFADAFNDVVAHGEGASADRLPLVSQVQLAVALSGSQAAGAHASSQPLTWPARPSVFLRMAAGMGEEDVVFLSNRSFWTSWNAHVALAQQRSAVDGGSQRQRRQRQLLGAGNATGDLSGVWRFVSYSGIYYDAVTSVPFSTGAFDRRSAVTHTAPRVCVSDGGASFIVENDLSTADGGCASIISFPLHNLIAYAPAILPGVSLRAKPNETIWNGDQLHVFPQSSSSPAPTRTSTSSAALTPSATMSVTAVSTGTGTAAPTGTSDPTRTGTAAPTGAGTPAATPPASSTATPTVTPMATSALTLTQTAVPSPPGTPPATASVTRAASPLAAATLPPVAPPGVPSVTPPATVLVTPPGATTPPPPMLSALPTATPPGTATPPATPSRAPPATPSPSVPPGSPLILVGLSMPGGTAADATDTATLSAVCAAVSAASGLANASACAVLSVTETQTGWSHSFGARRRRRQLAAAAGPALPPDAAALWRWLVAVNVTTAGAARGTVLQALGRMAVAAVFAPLAETWARATGQDASVLLAQLALDGVPAPPASPTSAGSSGNDGGGGSAVAIGAGVGGGVAGVLLIAALAAWLMVARHRSCTDATRKPAASAGASAGGGIDGADGGVDPSPHTASAGTDAGTSASGTLAAPIKAAPSAGATAAAAGGVEVI